MTVRPRSVGTFLIARPETSAKLSARSRMRSMSSRVRSSIEIRWRFTGPAPWPGSDDEIVRQSSASSGTSTRGNDCLRSRNDRDLVDAVDLLDADVDPLGARGREVLADV